MGEVKAAMGECQDKKKPPGPKAEGLVSSGDRI